MDLPTQHNCTLWWCLVLHQISIPNPQGQASKRSTFSVINIRCLYTCSNKTKVPMVADYFSAINFMFTALIENWLEGKVISRSTLTATQFLAKTETSRRPGTKEENEVVLRHLLKLLTSYQFRKAETKMYPSNIALLHSPNQLFNCSSIYKESILFNISKITCY